MNINQLAGGRAVLGRLALLWALVVPGESLRLPQSAGRDASGGCGLNLPSSHPLQASSRRSGCSSGP